MRYSIRHIAIVLVISFPSCYWGFERIITQNFQRSGQITPTTITVLSFHPDTTDQVVIPYNGDISGLIRRFDNYRYIYAAGQGLHAATRVHNVINL